MRSIGLLLLGVGLLAWSRSSPRGTRARYLLPMAGVGLVLAILSIRPQPPATAFEIAASASSPPIPDVHGMDPAEAVAALEDAGLVPRVIRACDPAGAGDAVSTASVVERRLWWGIGHTIVDETGVTPAAADVDPGTEVLLLVPDVGRCGDSRGTGAIPSGATP